MFVGQKSFPGVRSIMTSAALYSCLNHRVVNKRGQTKTWVESCRLILALRSSSMATSAAAGGGDQM